MNEEECIESVREQSGAWYYTAPIAQRNVEGPFRTRQDAMLNMSWWFA